ncbi:ArsR/SmtB family transcription factor [Erythrobacter mangrovi]|uniref:Winged helix-turn-helix transcriptional regulator n=1 Tax=Erythrobacter mangrovi TaxID=2739433 RepID=A0A7D4BNM3_9SPHN|nr:metalloregulator ArsR/SmtB family transcription factor [Erythrobacter mangrovi]QKG71144.1 winged helix-turn-helix transcriptional regulator [Erythrobacter mangrovi]
MTDSSNPERCPSIEALRALAHASRLKILCTIGEGRLSVGEIEEATGIGQPGLSQQLRILRDAGLVVGERLAKQVFYIVDRSVLDDLVARIGAIIPRDASNTPRSPDTKSKPGSGAAFARVLR